MGLLATVKVLLYRYTGQEDLIIGSPIAGRPHSDLEDQIGFYVNTLALRTQFSGTESYEQLLARVKKVTLDAYEHQSYPFDALVDELNLQADLSRSALFDVLLVLEHQSNMELAAQGMRGLAIRAVGEDRTQSKFDLQFNFIETEEALLVKVTYNTDLYHEDRIAQLLSHLKTLLRAIVVDPGMPVAELSYLSGAMQQQILGFNRSMSTAPAVTLTAAFKSQVRQSPDDIALVFEQTRLSYRELDEESDKLGMYLQDTYRLKAEDLVGIQQERTEWMIISLLAILKSGAAFVPIDPAYPQERIDYILSDSQCKVVLDESILQQYLSQRDQYTGKSLEDINTTADLAYVIYTSGSTGLPKGVMIPHGALYHYIMTIGRAYHLEKEERILQVSNFAFDAAVEQIMLALLNGASLHVISQALATDTAGLTDYIGIHEITHLHSVPTLLQEIDFTKTPGLRRVISAGEDCPLSLCRKPGNGVAFYNKYGPTEATISATLYKSGTVQELHNRVPIGRPLDNSRVYILNDHHQLQPLGVAGEICIAGNSLARGYLNQPALTAAQFIYDPYHKGDFLYRTGDLGKWQPDGNIVFLGRKDDQVKIRGHRIELDEIRAVLAEHPAVSTVVVSGIKDSSGSHLLVAYLVCEEELNPADLRNWLGSKLPHYMLPAHFVQMDALPLLPNGKLDKKALPIPEGAAAGTAYIAPRNQTEEQLVEIWQQILGLEQIGVQHNFFELGGHSLKATRLVSLIQKEFGIKVNMKDVFMNPTIETVGELIRAGIWLEHSKNNNKEGRNLVEI